MTTRFHTRLLPALAVGALLAACASNEGKSEYAKDGDSGAAAPATVQTPSPGLTPDSTTGQAQGTGKGMQSGDTLQAKGAAAGAPSTPPAVVPPAGAKRP